jgi:hypothetical protein
MHLVSSAGTGGRPRRRRALAGWPAAVAIAVAAALAPGAAAAQAAPADRLPAVQPATSSPAGGLDSVSAASATDVWAVGDFVSRSGAQEALIEHSAGQTWKKFPSPGLAGRNGTLRSGLTGVAAVSATDVWAVGWRQLKPGHQVALAEHFNGQRWTVVASPGTGGGPSILLAVSATSATDVWAVGDASPAAGGPATATLIEHWNGTGWTRVASPSPSPATDVLPSVSADSPTDAWAAGDSQDSGAASQTLIEHWNGTSWAQVTSPDPGAALGSTLRGVSAVSPSDVWAAGSYVQPGTGDIEQLLAHFNGHRWAQVTSPPSYSGVAIATGVSARARAGAWAVGESESSSGSYTTVTEEKTSVGWASVSSPSPGSTASGLSGLDLLSADDAWAVGQWQSGASFGPLILHWNGQEWSQS